MTFIIKKKNQDVYAKGWDPISMTLTTTHHRSNAFHNQPVHVLDQYDKENEFEIASLNLSILQ